MKITNSFVRLKFEEIIYIFSVSIYIFLCVIRQSFFSQYLPGFIFKGIFLLCSASVMLLEFTNRSIHLKEVVGIIISLGLAVCMANRSFNFFPLFIFVITGRNMNFRVVAKYVSIVLFGSIAIVILSSMAGLIPSHIARQEMSDGSVRIREFLGFRYALSPSALLFNAISLNLYANKENASRKRYLVYFLVSYWIFIRTDSKLNFLLTVLVIFVFLALHRFPHFMENLRVVPFLMVCSYVICAVCSIALTIYYGEWAAKSRFLREINVLAEGRLRHGYNALKTYPIKMFGTDIEFVGAGLTAEGREVPGAYNYVDNFYENILLRFGIVFFVSTLILITVTMFFIWKDKDYELLTVMTIIAGHGIFDDGILNLQANTFWILIGVCVFSNLWKKRIFSNLISNWRKFVRKKKLKCVW